MLTDEGGLRPELHSNLQLQERADRRRHADERPILQTIHPVYSENVIVRRVRVETTGLNNDGCDPDSSKNVLIEGLVLQHCVMTAS